MTNHKAESLHLFKEAEKSYGANVTSHLAAAQIHATLYLAEQHRIANLIALAQHSGSLSEEMFLLSDEAAYALIHTESIPATPFSGPDESFSFRPEIKEALGL